MKRSCRNIKLLIGIFFITYCCYSQNNPIQIELGTIKTQLKQDAINLGINYAKSLDSLFKIQDIQFNNKSSLFQLTPEFNVQTGNNDAFSAINAKLTGLFMIFQKTSVDGILTPNTSKGFQTFPISLGIETNNKFNILNVIAEVGWVPWYQTVGNINTPAFLKRTKFGLFLQSGYKFGIDSTGKSSVGGDIDESKESTDSGIFRAKAAFGIDTKSLFQLSGIGVGLVGTADGWYDFLNRQIYYSIQGKLRFYLTSNHDKLFDFKYQKGSGAPNFNQGDQFGMGLTLTF